MDTSTAADEQREFDALCRKMRPRDKHYRQAARGAGYSLPFFDYLDAYGTEYARIKRWAERLFPSVFAIVNERSGRIGKRAGGYGDYGIPSDWQAVRYRDPDAASKGYREFPDGDLTGDSICFLDPAGGLHTLVRVQSDATDKLAAWKLERGRLIVLLHEIGHVRDMEAGRHFDPRTNRADFVRGEASAHVFAHGACCARGLLVCAASLEATLRPWLEADDIRRLIAEAAFAQFSPIPALWHKIPGVLDEAVGSIIRAERTTGRA